jgi:hypothetical protein
MPDPHAPLASMLTGTPHACPNCFANYCPGDVFCPATRRDPCAFCGYDGCEHCAPDAGRATAVAPVGRRLRCAPPPKPQPEPCPHCLRSPGDLWRPRCVWCPPEPEGPQPCVKGCGRNACAAYGLCRKCYKSMPRAERRRLRPRPKFKGVEGWDQRVVIAAGPAPPTRHRSSRDADDPDRKAKVRVMAERARNRQRLFHPRDAGMSAEQIAAAFENLEAEVARRYLDPAGVYFAEDEGKWRARPWSDATTRHHLGYFEYEADAYAAVRVWTDLKKAHGPEGAAGMVREGVRRQKMIA